MAKLWDADTAALALEAAIKRNSGWQVQYDMQIVIEDRKRLLDRIAELEQLETEWGIHVEEPGQLPVIAIVDTEANARAGAQAARARVGRRSVVSVRSRPVGRWRDTEPTGE